MHEQSSPEKSGEFARLDGAILGLLATPYNQRPWSESEIKRAAPIPGDVHEAAKRLHRAGLVHRWSRLVSATAAAVRREEIKQHHPDNALLAADRRIEGEILRKLAQTASVHPMSAKDLRRALRVRQRDKLDFIDALDRLEEVGLIKRPAGLATLTDAAIHASCVANG